METLTVNKKPVAFRLKPELDEKIAEIQAIKEKETGLKLTRTQIIEMLVTAGLQKMKEDKEGECKEDDL